MHGFGSVVGPGSDLVFHEAWESRAFALAQLTGQLGLGAGPGGRVLKEEMGPERYLAASYYERSQWSTEQRLMAKGTIEPGEIERMVEHLGSGGRPSGPAADPGPAQREMMLAALREIEPLRPVGSARFAVGDAVRVRRMHPRGHTRCPRYVRGVTGRVERLQGSDVLPDLAAYGLDAPDETVYSVSFASDDLWGPSAEGTWTVLLDLWESYLEPVREAGEP
jgi:nitrile hydratase